MSKQKISIYQMEKSSLEFKKSHYVSVSGFSDTKPPKYFVEFQNQMLDFAKRVDKRFDQLESRIDQVEANLTARIDNLVAKNNLKE